MFYTLEAKLPFDLAGTDKIYCKTIKLCFAIAVILQELRCTFVKKIIKNIIKFFYNFNHCRLFKFNYVNFVYSKGFSILLKIRPLSNFNVT